MLHIDERAKALLRANGALVLDQDGDETLLGLTVSESNFLCDFPKSLADRRPQAEVLLYYRLRQQHLSARTAQAMKKLANVT